MSHITKIEIKVKNLCALKAACERLKLTFIEGQKTYVWYGRMIGKGDLPEGLTVNDLGHCDHAIKVPGAKYEIGVLKYDGHYRLLWDQWEAGGLEKVVGVNAGLLKQAYGLEKIKRVARRKGYSSQEVKGKNGSIKLKLTASGGSF